MNGSNCQKIIIVGVGETAAIAYEYFTHDSPHEVVAFSVESKFVVEENFMGLPVVEFENLAKTHPPEDFTPFVAVSSTKLNRVRTRLFKELKENGYTCASYVSSRAFVWHNVEYGENCFIFEGNTLQPFVRVGDNVVLWSGNHIGHNSVIEDNCFLSSHVVVSGFCEIGRNSFLGVNSTVVDNVKIGRDCLVGAGAVVTKNADAGKIYTGNPAKASNVSSLRYFRVKE